MRRSSAVLVVSICGALSASAPALAQEGRAGDVIPGKYIVVAEEGRDPAAVARWQNARDRQVLPLVNGFAATLDAAQVQALRASARVAYVEPDRVVTADATQNMDANGDPWGLDRIDQRSLPLSRTYTYTSTGAGVTAYIIDTGIHAGHPQFGGRAQRRLRRARRQRRRLPRPRHARGRHDRRHHLRRRQGASQLRGVRVLGCTGSGSTSGIIAGDRLGARQRGRAGGRQHVARRRPLDVAQHGGATTWPTRACSWPWRRATRTRTPATSRPPGASALHDRRVRPDGPEGVVLQLRLVRGRLRAGLDHQVGLARQRHAHHQRHVDGLAARGGRGALYKAAYGDASSATIVELDQHQRDDRRDPLEPERDAEPPVEQARPLGAVRSAAGAGRPSASCTFATSRLSRSASSFANSSRSSSF